MRLAIATIVSALAIGAPATASADPLVVDASSRGCSDARPPAAVRVAAPWCSIERAVAAAPSDSTVYIRAGSYPYQKLHGLGSRRDYVTLEPYGYGSGQAEDVTIAGVSTANTRFLRFRGLHLVGSDVKGLVPAARVYLNSSHIDLIGNDITGEGIYVQGARYVRIERNHIHDLRRNCAVKQVGDGGGIFVQRSAHVAIIGNNIEDAIQDALNFGAIPDVLVRGNDVSNAHGRMCGDHTDLVQIEGGGRGPMRFIDNVFHDGGQFILRNATGLKIANNLILRVNNWMSLTADPGARVVGNIWFDGNRTCAACGSLLIRQRGAFPYADHMDGTVVKDNVMRLFANAGVPRSDYREDRNVIYGPRANNSGIEGRHTRLIGPTARAVARQQARNLGRLGAVIAPARVRDGIAVGVRVAAAVLW